MSEAIRQAAMSGYDPSMTPPNWGLEYSWIKTDAGKSGSLRPRQKNDCTVRALAIARLLPYDTAYNTLAEAGRKCGKGFKFSEWINTQEWARKISFPALKGQRRMNPATFTESFPKGIFICKVAKHVFAVKDGIVYDDFENAPDRCIYTAWEITL